MTPAGKRPGRNGKSKFLKRKHQQSRDAAGGKVLFTTEKPTLLCCRMAAPAPTVTLHTVEEMVKMCLHGDVSRFQEALDEMTKEHNKMREDTGSLRKTVVEVQVDMMKLDEDNNSLRQALQVLEDKMDAGRRDGKH